MRDCSFYGTSFNLNTCKLSFAVILTSELRPNKSPMTTSAIFIPSTPQLSFSTLLLKQSSFYKSIDKNDAMCGVNLLPNINR